MVIFQYFLTKRYGIRYGSLSISAFLFLQIFCMPGSAQTSVDQVRKLLGKEVNIEQGALFAANRSSYKELCGTVPKFEWHATIINRLQYGSFDAEQKILFKQLMITQMTSNQTIFNGLDFDARKNMCEGLDATITFMSAKFLEEHPSIFIEVKSREIDSTSKKNRAHIDEIDNNNAPEARVSTTGAIINPITYGAEDTNRVTPEEALLEYGRSQQNNTFIDNLKKSATSGGSWTYSILADINRAADAGLANSSWDKSAQDVWVHTHEDIPLDQRWRYYSTNNELHASLIYRDAKQAEKDQRVMSLRTGSGVSVAGFILRIWDIALLVVIFWPLFLGLRWFLRIFRIRL